MTDFGLAAYAAGPLSFYWFDPNTAQSTRIICAGVTEKNSGRDDFFRL